MIEGREIAYFQPYSFFLVAQKTHQLEKKQNRSRRNSQTVFAKPKGGNTSKYFFLMGKNKKVFFLLLQAVSTWSLFFPFTIPVTVVSFLVKTRP
jgi:hypothetical protein